MRGLFVAGTDTGVGKTVVACALAAWLRESGCDVGVMKPIATGARRYRVNGRIAWVSDDARQLARAAGARDPWSLVSPVCYAEPLAPWTAAQRQGRPVDVGCAVRALRRLARRHEFLIVEGIGGLLVPLGPRRTVADLVKHLRLPIVLVARPGLGTLNHTLLSLEAARARGIAVRGIFVNWSARAARARMARVAEQTNPQVLAACGGVPVVGRLPWLGPGERRPPALARWLERHTQPCWLAALRDGWATGPTATRRLVTRRRAARRRARVDRVSRAVVESAQFISSV